jgi:hypothetical protein
LNKLWKYPNPKHNLHLNQKRKRSLRLFQKKPLRKFKLKNPKVRMKRLYL